jgi:hypothetical protein
VKARDADVAGADPLGDPLVGGVGARLDDDDRDQRVRARTQPAVGHVDERDTAPFGDLQRLGAHRAGVGIDVDHLSSAR